MSAKLKKLNLVDKLLNAYQVCRDCGSKYGTYSVGCSSNWISTCDVCGEEKQVTESRDWGYLSRGIEIERALNDFAEEKEEEMMEQDPPSYEEGDIVCHFTEDEVIQLLHFIEIHAASAHDEDFQSARHKLQDLFDDYCVKYELSPAMKAYYEKYGTFGDTDKTDEARWEGFRDAYNSVNQLKN